MLPRRARRRPRIAPAWSSGVFRFDQGVRRGKSEATFGPLTPVMKLRPPMATTVSTPGRLEQDLLDLPHHRVGALDGGGVGKLDVHQEIALVLGGREAGGHHAQQAVAQRRSGAAARPPRGRTAGRYARRSDRSPLVSRKNAAFQVRASQRLRVAPAGRSRSAQSAGVRRERVQRGERHRDRDGQGELPVELAGDAGQEGDGDEHRHQHERGGDDRAHHLRRGAPRGLAGARVPPRRGAAGCSPPPRWRRPPRSRWPGRGRTASAC